MAEPVTTAETFQFTPRGGQTLELHGALESYNDKVKIRLARFEYLKRNGGEVEPMGAGQMEFSFRLVFMGAAEARRYREIVQIIRTQPRGLLNHLRLGKINVGCTDINNQERPGAGRDVLEVTIDFIEDAVDQAIASGQDPGPQRRAGQIAEASTNLAAAVASIALSVTAAAYTALNLALGIYTASSAAFGAQALASSQTNTWDPALEGMKDRVKIKMDLLISAARDTGLPDAQLCPILSQARLVFAACVDLYNAVVATKPPLISYVLPTAMGLNTVLVTVYGKDARAKRDEALLLNPFLRSHYWLSQGTKLRLTAPEVRQ